jgi:energy-coupling factor transport system ATP-binding protein
MKPGCIVLDEPTAMLDPSGRREVIETVLRLNRDEGISVILITHYMEEAVRADRVIVMDNGMIAMEGSPKQIFSKVEELKSYGLDAPQAAELAFMLRKEGIELPSDILTMFELAAGLRPFKPGESSSWQSVPPIQKEEIPPLAEATAGRSASPILETKDLSFIYNVGSTFAQTALDNINITIYPGEFVGLIGHTGSGKSTLIQHFNAILPASSGQVLLNGEDVKADKSKLRSIRQRVGLVFQYPEHQLFEMTILKDVSFGPESMKLSSEEVKERAEQALLAVGIDRELFDKSPFDLSGGQKRRVAIAGVLAMRPEVLILDEPTAGLDPRGRDEILERIKTMRDTLNITVILISHSMEDVAKLADRIIVINKGRLSFAGTPGEVFSHVDELESMGLAAPQTTYLMRELKSNGWRVDDVYTLADARDILLSLLLSPR